MEKMPDQGVQSQSLTIPSFFVQNSSSEIFVKTDVRQNNRRVLVIFRWPVGGIRTYIHYIYPRLLEAGYRFTFVGPAEESFFTLQKELNTWPDCEWIEVPVINQKCRFWPAIRKILKQNRFALINSHGFTAAIQAVIGNFGLGIPHIFTSHDIIRPEAQFPGIYGAIKLWFLGQTISRVNVLVAVGHDACKNHLQFLPKISSGPCSIVTIPNGIDAKQFLDFDQRMDFRKKIGLKEDTFLLGFVGRVEDQKGFLPLLEALDKLAHYPQAKSFHLIVVGRAECPRRYRSALANCPALAGHITFFGHIPKAASVLNELDLLLMPSLWEARSLLAMEAMCVGVPLIGTDCTGLGEILVDTPSIVVPAGNSDALACAILKAMHDPWTSAARNFAPIARERFDVKRPAEDLLSLFNSFFSDQ